MIRTEIAKVLLIVKKHPYYTAFSILAILVSVWLGLHTTLFLTPLPLLVLLFHIYQEEYWVPHISKKRKEKAFSLLLKTFKNSHQTSDDQIHIQHQGFNVLIDFELVTSLYGTPTYGGDKLNYWLDLSHFDKKIQHLCAIHFYCTRLNNRLYRIGSVESSFLPISIESLVRKSETTINTATEEVIKYVASKNHSKS